MKLSPSQIRLVDEIQIDKRAHSHTLKVALNFHANMQAEVLKKDQRLWEDLSWNFGLDTSKCWKIDSVDGVDCVMEKTDKDKVQCKC